MPAHRKDTTPAPDPLSLAVGERIVELRTRASMTPPELADRLGMDVNYLWRVERGRQNLSFRNVARFARAFGLSMSEFVEGIDITDVAMESRPWVRRSDDEPKEE